MKKIGSLHFYDDVDLNLKFNFEDLMGDFEKNTVAIEREFLDENKSLKMDVIEKYVKEYVNRKIKDKFGKDFSLDVMDDTMNISWDIKVESIKKHHHEAWWNKEK
jgi:hypothetical protein